MTGKEPAATDNTISGGVFLGPVVQGRDIQATFHLPVAAPTALAQLPTLTAGFTGRNDELTTLATLLDAAGSSDPVLVAAVAGLAGVGKTTLAVQAGHAAMRHGWFDGGVLFLDLHGYDEQPVEPGQALDALLRGLGVPAEHIPPGTEERAGLYRSVLAQTADPVLLIADNASSEAQVRLLLPGTGPHRVLVTSRHTLAGLEARLIDVTTFDDAASVALIEKALQAARPDDNRITTDPAAASRLAATCGGLPLALQITASILKADPTLTAAELADELAEEWARLDRMRFEDGSGTGGQSVAAAFELSYRRLDGTAARVFRLLTVNPGPDVSLPAAATLADLPAARMRPVLSGLSRAHLIEPVSGATARWRMHDLVRLFAKRLGDREEDSHTREQAALRLILFYIRMAYAADEHLRPLPGMVVAEAFTGREEALTWLDAERASLIGAVSMSAAVGVDKAAASLALDLAPYLKWRRRFDDLAATATMSLDAGRRLGDRQIESKSLNNLAVALQETRRFEEAITTYQDAAALYRDTGDRHGEGIALNNLGTVLGQVRRFGEALTAYQDAAAIFRDTGDRHGEGNALNNLGTVLQNVRRFGEAMTALEDAAALYRDTGDRHGEGMSLDNLGTVLEGVRRFDEAITAHQDAAAIFRETGDPHGEGTALTNLGTALREVRRFDEAITAHQDAAAIFRETGDRHGEASALHSFGLALGEVRWFDEAITALEDAAAIFRETGDRHREASALGSLGTALREVGRFDEAITAHQDSAAIYRETGDHHSEASALGSLGIALREVGRFDEAITACQEDVAICRETGDHHSEGMALGTLGLTLQEVGRFDEAITAHQDSAAIFGQAGDNHRERIALRHLEAARAARQGGHGI
jgi:tetratricopeptide (TPR) repeat protein